MAGRMDSRSVSGQATLSAVRRVPVNMSLPEDLVRQLDEVAGPRNRSAFAEDALRRAIKREQWRRSIELTAGSLKAEDYPHWRTSEDVVRWVEEMRAQETDPGMDDRA